MVDGVIHLMRSARVVLVGGSELRHLPGRAFLRPNDGVNSETDSIPLTRQRLVPLRVRRLARMVHGHLARDLSFE